MEGREREGMDRIQHMGRIERPSVNTLTVPPVRTWGHLRLDNILPRQGVILQEGSSICLSSRSWIGKTTGLNKTALRLGSLSDECSIALQRARLSRTVLAWGNGYMSLVEVVWWQLVEWLTIDGIVERDTDILLVRASQALETDGTTHRHVMAWDVNLEASVLAKSMLYSTQEVWYLITRNLRAGKRLLLIKNTNFGSKLVDLTVIGEHGNEWTRCPWLAIAVDVCLVRTVDKSLDDGVENRLHQCVVLSGTRTYRESAFTHYQDIQLTWLTRTVIVAQVLCVLILVKLIIGENVAPWRSTSSNLCLKTAQVGEVSDIRLGEVEVALDMAVDAFSDCRQVYVVPGCKIVTTTIVAVCGAGVRRSERVCHGLRDIGLEHIDISVGRVGPKITSSKQPASSG
jgi:hypothetical protein